MNGAYREFRAYFMESLKEIALANGQSPEDVEKNGPLGLELLTSMETFELCCRLEDEFGMDFSGYERDELVENVEAVIREQSE